MFCGWCTEKDFSPNSGFIHRNWTAASDLITAIWTIRSSTKKSTSLKIVSESDTSNNSDFECASVHLRIFIILYIIYNIQARLHTENLPVTPRPPN